MAGINIAQRDGNGSIHATVTGNTVSERELAEGAQSWAVPWPCVYDFFSVVTNPRIWKDAASTPAQAWAQIEAWLSSPTLRLLGETQEFAALLSRFLTLPRVRGPVVHDARVAALCVAHGGSC